jgi:riboflavin kinase, archaea type
MKIKGKIARGIGESGSFLGIPWVNKQLCDKLQFTPWQGTLNIVVDDEDAQRLLKEKGKERLVAEQAGFCDALIFRALLNDTYECGIVLPLVPDYSCTLFEIVAPIKIKETLGVDDGDEVTVDIFLS